MLPSETRRTGTLTSELSQSYLYEQWFPSCENGPLCRSHCNLMFTVDGDLLNSEKYRNLVFSFFLSSRTILSD